MDLGLNFGCDTLREVPQMLSKFRHLKTLECYSDSSSTRTQQNLAKPRNEATKQPRAAEEKTKDAQKQPETTLLRRSE